MVDHLTHFWSYYFACSVAIKLLEEVMCQEMPYKNR